MKIDVDIKLLIEWLGVDGARIGLNKSKRLTLNELYRIAENNQIDYNKKVKRSDLINLIILKFDKRIDKSFDEMTNMSASDLAEYLSRTGCTREELIQLLEINEIPYKKSDSLIGLIHHAADQISGLGVYRRIANK